MDCVSSHWWRVSSRRPLVTAFFLCLLTLHWTFALARVFIKALYMSVFSILVYSSAERSVWPLVCIQTEGATAGCILYTTVTLSSFLNLETVLNLTFSHQSQTHLVFSHSCASNNTCMYKPKHKNPGTHSHCVSPIVNMVSNELFHCICWEGIVLYGGAGTVAKWRYAVHLILNITLAGIHNSLSKWRRDSHEVDEI